MADDLWVDEVSEDRGWSARVLPYGIEAPYVPAGLGAGGAACCALAGWRRSPWVAAIGVALLAQAGLYLHTTVRGKVRVWRRELDRLGLRGNEQLLDLGCGRGAVLIEAARHLPAGLAVGVDLWRSQDQSRNDPGVALANARAAGVADRVELHTADMTVLPFPDGYFDVVTSALAIHNISTAEGRHQALDEAVRVLRPGGRLLIADFRCEVEAESIAYVVATAQGMDSSGYSFAYVAGWAGPDLSIVRQAADTVTQTARRILAPLDAAAAAGQESTPADRRVHPG